MGRAVLKIEVSSTSFKTGVAYEYGYRQPAAPAHDRGHERAQALRGHAAGPRPQLQAVRRISQAVSRDGHARSHPPLPAALGRDWRKHLHSQRHHDWAEVPVARDA